MAKKSKASEALSKALSHLLGGKVPCQFKIDPGYCGKTSTPASNYCAEHGVIMKARYEGMVA